MIITLSFDKLFFFLRKERGKKGEKERMKGTKK